MNICKPLVVKFYQSQESILTIFAAIKGPRYSLWLSKIFNLIFDFINSPQYLLAFIFVFPFNQ